MAQWKSIRFRFWGFWVRVPAGLNFSSLLEELNKIDNTNYKKLLKAIEYHYYSKKYTNGKEEKKSDKKGVKIIKEFLLEMYKKFGAVKKKNDDE